MKFAIRTSNGEIILPGADLDRLKQYVRVNPTASIVKKSRNKWAIISEAVICGY